MTTCTTNTCHATVSQGPRISFLDRVLLTLSIHKQRQRLSSLDDHLLRDIGMTREKAEREAKRKLWDVPQHWLR